MAKKVLSNLLGSWAFLVGILLAVITGVVTGMGWANWDSTMVTGVLAVIGLIVGILNITAKESNQFLLSGLVLILASVFGMSIMASVTTAPQILAALLAMFVPAVIIVAVKSIFSVSKN